jgi:hypothetical protein
MDASESSIVGIELVTGRLLVVDVDGGTEAQTPAVVASDVAQAINECAPIDARAGIVSGNGSRLLSGVGEPIRQHLNPRHVVRVFAGNLP